MKSIQKLSLILSMSALLLLSGCIKMTVNQTIEEGGTSQIEVVYDVTEMYEQLESLGEGVVEEVEGAESEGEETIDPFANAEEDLEESCDTFFEETTWENAECTIDEYVFTMSGNVTLESSALTMEGGVYRFDLKHLYTLLSAVGDSQDQEFSDAALEEQKELVEFTGIELTYNLTMPGPITMADVGTFEEGGNTLTVDLFDMAGMETAYVEAKVGGFPLGAMEMGAIGAVLVIFIAGVAIVKRKPQKPTPTTEG